MNVYRNDKKVKRLPGTFLFKLILSSAQEAANGGILQLHLDMQAQQKEKIKER